MHSELIYKFVLQITISYHFAYWNKTLSEENIPSPRWLDTIATYLLLITCNVPWRIVLWYNLPADFKCQILPFYLQRLTHAEEWFVQTTRSAWQENADAMMAIKLIPADNNASVSTYYNQVYNIYYSVRSKSGNCLCVIRVSDRFALKSDTSHIVGDFVWGLKKVQWFCDHVPMDVLCMNNERAHINIKSRSVLISSIMISLWRKSETELPTISILY